MAVVELISVIAFFLVKLCSLIRMERYIKACVCRMLSKWSLFFWCCWQRSRVALLGLRMGSIQNPGAKFMSRDRTPVPHAEGSSVPHEGLEVSSGALRLARLMWLLHKGRHIDMT